ncbi:hypothetical protein GA0061071_10196 [Kosakonia oryzendophytica]|uniref:Transposase n=1 Tax=Kosakonia oryzendophytica TaxID=1005665 RepID=A0A1C3YS50_9ENTR|nr:hypothetical protein GA0061071_10196 [Kosakonia oryzendophytica]
MKRYFRRRENERVPVIGYISLSDATREITDHIIGYYSVLRAYK